MTSQQVFIVSAARTPIGSFQGSLSKVSPQELGSIAIKEVLKRANVSSEDISEVIMGQSLATGQGQNPARQASLKAGIPIKTPAYLINMLCGSGLKSVMLGYQSILTGDSVVSICGGQESMSQSPHCMHLRNGTKMGNGTLIDTMLNDGLTDAMENIHMGVTAENLAKDYQITREECDLQALKSQNLAEVAQTNGYFDKEIVPVETVVGRDTISLSFDEYVKKGTVLPSLTKLRPCFQKDGIVTAGNASGINDSAAAVLLMSENEANRRNLKPLARIVGFSQSGVEPKIMGAGVIPAVQNLLKKINWTIDEVDLFELNEAFAAQALSVNKGLGIDGSKVNIHGGAIALGHPIGASGTRVLVTLLYALERTGGKKGIASLCIGGGMGIAIAVERV